jgi:hypothetical protein
MDVIESVLESTIFFEAPKRFYYWATLSAISAVLKDRVWFNMGDNYNVYPNIYVLLYGPSGVRKGPAINLAEDLVHRVDNTRVIDGRSSIEAIIKELGTMTTKNGRPPIKDSCGFMVASELSSSIIGNAAAMDIMTNLYDRIYNEREWKYRLKVGESARLNKPTITWLSGTNEALFREFVPEKNLHGGLIGRMFIISESKKSTTNSLMFKTRSPDKAKIAQRLREISLLTGEFEITEEVRVAIDAWYVKFDTELAPELKDETGFVSRILDFIMKIAMIISSGRRGDKKLLISDITEATNVVLPLVVPTKKVVNAIKKSDNSLVTKRALVLTYLTNSPEFKCERGKMLRNLGLQIDQEDLDKIVTLMQQMNVLDMSSGGGSIIYRLKTERKEVQEWIQQFRS